MTATATFVPIQIVREHVRRLRSNGMSNRTIAEAAGTHYGNFNRLLYSRKLQYCHRLTAQALLAVELDLSRTGHVNATGTRRRIQALGCIGWAQTDIADRLACDHSLVSAWARRSVVTRFTHNMVRDVYEQIYSIEGPTPRATRWARRRNWAPPEAWTDGTIDDPQAKPFDWREGDVDEVAVAKVGIGELPFGTLSRAEKMALWRQYSGTAPLVQLQRRWRVSWKTLNQLREAAETMLEAA